MRISSLKIVPLLAAQCLLRARGGTLRVSAPLLLFAMLCVFPLIVAPQHLATAQAPRPFSPDQLGWDSRPHGHHHYLERRRKDRWMVMKSCAVVPGKAKPI